MTRDLEDYLWRRIPGPVGRTIGSGIQPGPMPREVVDEMLSAGMIQNAKQAHRTLEK